MKDFNYYYNLFLDMLDLYEFDLAVDEENYWRVIDRQGGNLGGIEQEQFETLASIVDRMEAYHNDYIIGALEEGFPEIEYSDWQDLSKRVVELAKEYNEDLAEWEFDIRVLDMIINGEPILSNKQDNEDVKDMWREENK